MKPYPMFVFGLLSAVLAGCSSLNPSSASGPEAKIHLTATLTSPIDIALLWTDAGAKVRGYVVEWATQEKGEYVILDFLPPYQTNYAHNNLMPETKHYYRIRPYFGPVCDPVEITTGKQLPEGAPLVYNDPDPEHWSDPKSIPLPAGVTITKQSIRNPLTADEATPTDLTATLVHPTGVKLTWTDRATDAEGYLVELKTDAMPEYQVCALLDPGINSIGYGLLPPKTKVSFRVRAFYYGKTSNLVWKTTQTAPPGR